MIVDYFSGVFSLKDILHALVFCVVSFDHGDGCHGGGCGCRRSSIGVGTITGTPPVPVVGSVKPTTMVQTPLSYVKPFRRYGNKECHCHRHSTQGLLLPPLACGSCASRWSHTQPPTVCPSTPLRHYNTSKPIESTSNDIAKAQRPCGGSHFLEKFVSHTISFRPTLPIKSNQSLLKSLQKLLDDIVLLTIENEPPTPERKEMIIYHPTRKEHVEIAEECFHCHCGDGTCITPSLISNQSTVSSLSKLGGNLSHHRLIKKAKTNTWWRIGCMKRPS